MEITKEEFLAYENVRQSGLFNMITDAQSAADYAGLDFDTYVEIINNYSSLKEEFLNDKDSDSYEI